MSSPELTSSHLFNIKGKVVLITGGGTGLGKAMATGFVQSGAKVYIASRKISQLEATVLELNALARSSGQGGSCLAVAADLRDKAGCDALAAQMKEREEKLHVLINNSGMGWAAPLEDFDEKNGWDRVMALNVKSIFYLTAALLPLLSKDVNNIDPGRVINITSVWGSKAVVEMALSNPGWGSYSYATSKAAANHVTRILAASLAGKNISVNGIAPGIFPSNMTRHGIKNELPALLSEQPTGRLGTPEDIAGIALFLSSRAGSHITGAIIPVDGGSSLGLEKSKL
ncbi:hypothetical protein BDY24DRAFT_407844 [Mrakia frigida]|uniref:uncharacterized protein n=1 Tax=Mrakia frigida TaxID=29902 RepID=UPI003FCC03F4